MTKDVWGPEWDEYFAHARDELEPNVRDSLMMLTLMADKIDPKLAIETGYGVLLDKPFILVIKPGQEIPENMRRLAVQIVEADDLSSKDAQEALYDAIKAIQEDPRVKAQRADPEATGDGGSRN